jgi:hypothetical protein
VKWQYRTILFEFRKDGLLGDRYIDDDEKHKVLKEQGQKGWELVSVTPVQEGLLSFFKKVVPQPAQQMAPQQEQTPAKRMLEKPQPVRRGVQQPVSRPVRAISGEQKKAGNHEPKPDGVGGIKIS